MQFTSLNEPIKPTAFQMQNFGLTNIQVKIQAAHVLDLKDDLTKAWKAVAPEWPLEFSFLDERVDQAYQAETRSLKLFSVFTVIAILLSCLGIYGLSAFSVQSRLREVGIRKVFRFPSILR
jgi:putative ABC transport system permease protein